MGSPNSLCLQPNLGPINTLSGGEKHNLSIDSVEINLIIELLMRFGSFIILEKRDNLLVEIKESLCTLNLEGF